MIEARIQKIQGDLEKCQKFNRELLRHITALVGMIEAGNPPPDGASLKAALVVMVQRSARAAEEK